MTTRPAGGILTTVFLVGQRSTPTGTRLVTLLWGGGLATVLTTPGGELLGASFVLLATAAVCAWTWNVTALRWPLAVSAGASALLLFGSLERSLADLIVTDNQLVVRLDGAQLAVEQPDAAAVVGIALEPYTSSRAAARSGDPATAPLAQTIVGWSVGGNLLSGATDFTVSGAADLLVKQDAIAYQAATANSDWTYSSADRDAVPLQGPAGPYDRIASATDQPFLLSFKLIRPTTPVHVLVAGPRGSTAIVLYPEHSSIVLLRQSANGAWTRIAGGPLIARKTLVQSAQQLARLAGRAILTASASLALLLLAGAALARWRRLTHMLTLAPPPGAKIAAALTVTALIASGYVAGAILEQMPHVQDSVAYLFQARTFALGRIAVDAPPVSAAFVQEFVLMRDGLWFSKYPPGHAVVLALGVLAGVPWLVGPVAGAAALGLTFLLARDVYDSWTALLAVLLLLTSPFFLLMSGTMMSHPTGLLLTMVFVWQIQRAERSNSHQAAAIAGFALGALLASRLLTGIAMSAPFLLWVLVRVVQERQVRARHIGLVVGALPPVLGLLAYNWTLTGSPLLNPFELWWEFDRIGFGKSVGMHGGHYLSWGLVNTWANLTELQRWLSGWPVQLALVLPLLPFLAGTRRVWDWLLGAAFLALVVAYVFYWADGIMFGPRYYYEAVAALAILSARGVAVVGEVAGRLWRTNRDAQRAATCAAVIVVAGLVVGTTAVATPAFLAGSWGYNGMNRRSVDVVRRADVHNALVIVASQPGNVWQTYGSVFWANSPRLDGDVIYARDLGDQANRELVRAFPQRTAYLLSGDRLHPYGTGVAGD